LKTPPNNPKNETPKTTPKKTLFSENWSFLRFLVQHTLIDETVARGGLGKDTPNMDGGNCE
jgi:hypothetical protein